MSVDTEREGEVQKSGDWDEGGWLKIAPSLGPSRWVTIGFDCFYVILSLVIFCWWFYSLV